MSYTLVMKAYSDIPWFKPYMLQDSKFFKRKLVDMECLLWKCSRCGIDEWEEVAPLQLDHINGDRMDCTLDNLRLLCPNCHALTPTFMGKNMSRSLRRIPDKESEDAYDAVASRTTITLPTVGSVYREMGYPNKPRNWSERTRMSKVLGESRPLQPTARRKRKTKIDQPSDKTLERLLRSKSREAVGEILGVSGTAVKKRCLSRNIPEPSSLKGRQRPRQPKSSNAIPPAPIDREAYRREKSMERLSTLHGTRSGYLMEGRLKVERCAECRAANTAYQLEFNARRRETNNTS